MIKRLYNPWTITNEGERAADRHFILPPGREDEPFMIIHGLRLNSRYHRTQMSGECDFVILTKAGLMIMEVKGGLIGYGLLNEGDRGFYRLDAYEGRDPVKDPFLQADGNADAISRYLKEKGIIYVFTGRMACFPECVFEGDNTEMQDLWHLGKEKMLPEMILDALNSQISTFIEKQALKNVALPIQWKTMDEPEMLRIAELLSPEFEPRIFRTKAVLNRVESERRLEEGIHILSGLDENKRIMVQGPPGSGKTTYALKLIAKLCQEEGKTGLYLCWNELLAAKMREKLAGMDPPIADDKLHVAPLYRFIDELANLIGDASLKPTFLKVENALMKELIIQCLSMLHSRKLMKKYDFIIADEAQDLFAKGLDHILKYLLKENNALQKGNYYIFYDDRQAYPGTAELSAYIRTRDTLKEYSAFYMLFSNLRINTGQGLMELIMDAGMSIADPKKEYGEDVRFITFKNLEDAVLIIRQRIDQELALSQLIPSKIMVLLAADLFKDKSLMKTVLSANADFELMTPENHAQPTDKIRYTTILKSKGLEWDAVILVFSSLADSKSQYQLFVGASRARGRVVILMDKN